MKPLPAGSPLWNLPNTILTPEYGDHTREAYQRGVEIFIQNVQRYMADEALKNVVNRQHGD